MGLESKSPKRPREILERCLKCLANLISLRKWVLRAAVEWQHTRGATTSRRQNQSMTNLVADGSLVTSSHVSHAKQCFATSSVVVEASLGVFVNVFYHMGVSSRWNQRFESPNMLILKPGQRVNKSQNATLAWWHHNPISPWPHQQQQQWQITNVPFLLQKLSVYIWFYASSSVFVSFCGSTIRHAEGKSLYYMEAFISKRLLSSVLCVSEFDRHSRTGTRSPF